MAETSFATYAPGDLLAGKYMLEDMVGSAKELDLHMTGASETVELRNVEKVESLISEHGIRVTTKQNVIYIDASHVSMAWQTRL